MCGSRVRLPSPSVRHIRLSADQHQTPTERLGVGSGELGTVFEFHGKIGAKGILVYNPIPLSLMQVAHVGRLDGSMDGWIVGWMDSRSSFSWLP